MKNKLPKLKDIKQELKDYKKKLTDYSRNNRYLLKPFITLFLIYLLAFSAILLSGVHYADDIARTTLGYPGWSGFSRYLSTILSAGIHGDRYLTNVSPLPQIIAIALLAIASTMVICLISGKEIFKEKWTKWVWRVIAVLPLGICPYFLECISYQYDSPYMALSILFAVFPLLFRKKSRIIFVCLTILSIWGLCTTYQAAAGIFLVLTIILGLKDWNEGGKKSLQNSIKFMIWSCIGFFFALLIFSKLLMVHNDSYVSNSTPELNVFFSEFISHITQFYKLVATDFKKVWLALLGIIGFSFILLFTIRSKQNKFIAAILAIAGLAAMLIATYAPYSALAKPLYNTRAMYAIGTLVAALGVYIASEYKWQKLANLPILVLVWCFFVFAFTYGNALKEQTIYRDRQVDMVISDLNEILPTLEASPVTLKIDGQIGYTPIINNMPQRDYRLVHRLIKSSFGRNIPWMAFQLTGGMALPGTIYDPAVVPEDSEMPILKDTVLYTIRSDNETVLIEFKGQQMNLDF